jgi:hypothetical protein
VVKALNFINPDVNPAKLGLVYCTWPVDVMLKDRLVISPTDLIEISHSDPF